MLPDHDYENSPHLDVVFVPGGYGEGFETLLRNPTDPFFQFLTTCATKAELICSVCVGAHLLARAGLLAGYRCTTHWAFRQSLELFPEVSVVSGTPGYVIDCNRITGGGISSGIDQALAIAELLRGKDAAGFAQLSMQYAPQPGSTSGNPSQASPKVLYQVGKTVGGGGSTRF